MSKPGAVSARDVRTFAVLVEVEHITRSPAERREYQRLRTKLVAACGGDADGLGRIAALDRAARASLARGRCTDGATIDRWRTTVNHLIAYYT